jgi:hypothetical protein
MTIDRPNPQSHPNARADQPGATEPAGRQAIPDEFARRHVDIRPTGTTDVPTLAQAREAAPTSPNALPPTVDLRLRGGQPAQAAAAPDRARRGGVLMTHASLQERAQGPREPYDPGWLGYPPASLGAAIANRPRRRR